MAAISTINVGDITIHAIVDAADPRTFNQVEDLLLADAVAVMSALVKMYPNPDDLVWTYTPLLVQTGGQTVLVDTGFGPAAQPEQGQLGLGLAELGISPADVDRVIITHAHGDHYMGLVDGDGQPTYPNADVVMQSAEYAHWLGPDGVAEQNPEQGQRLKAAFDPVAERIVQVEGEVELAPGVQAVLTPGHTPGHIGLMFESNGERAWTLVDALHVGVQFAHPDWSLTFDTDPDLAAETRQHVLARAADEELLTLLYHLKNPLGHVVRDGENRFRWEPVGA